MKENVIIGQIFDAVKSVTGIERSMIASGLRLREFYFARMIATYQLKKHGYNIAEINLLVGNVSERAVYYQLKTYSEEKTPYFRRCAEQVDKRLSDHVVNP